MKMAKAGMTGLKPVEKVAHARAVVVAMTGNLNFTTPTPTLIQVGDDADDLDVKIMEAANGDREKIALRNKAERVLDDRMLRLSLYVSNVAQGDEAIILSSGFQARRTPEPIGQPAQPQNLRIESGPVPGSLLLRWGAVNGAYIYHVEMNGTEALPPEGWAMVDECSTASFLVTGLEPGRYYWFRVRAIGADPLDGPYSDPAKGYTTPLP